MKKESKPIVFYFFLFFIPSVAAFLTFLYFLLREDTQLFRIGAILSVLISSLILLGLLLCTTHFDERPGVKANVLRRLFLVFPVICTIGMVILVFEQVNSFIDGLVVYLTFPLLFNLFYNMTLCFVYIFFKESKYKIEVPSKSEPMPTVTVLMATRNEPFDVAKMTFDSAFELEYPKDRKELMVVDNSELDYPDYKRWKEYVESFGKKHNIKSTFIHRDGTEGFKPRNLDIAMDKIDSDYVMLMDIDSTVNKETLVKVIPEFIENDKLGFVQLQTTATNSCCGAFSKVISLLQTTQRYVLNMRGHGGFVLFYGHNGIWRMKAAEKAGNWLEYYRNEPMITEDMALTIRGYLAGFYGKTIWIESGEWVPGALGELESMWLRWTYGNSQVLWKYMPAIFLSKKLTFFEKLDMIQTAILYISCGLAPIFAIIGLLHPSTSFFGFCYIVISFLPPLFLAIGCLRKTPGENVSIFKKLWLLYSAFFVVNSYIAWIMAEGMFNFLICKRQGWKPTGKTSDGKIGWMSLVTSRLGVIFFSLIGIVVFVSVVLSRAIHHLLTHNYQQLIYMSPGLIFIFNLILCVLLYGRSTMPEKLDLDKMNINSPQNPFG